MTCDACVAAETTPRLDEFTANCMSCKARALAAIGAHLESKAAQRMTKNYVDALKSIFGDGWKDGADQVKAWGEAMARKDGRQRLRETMGLTP